MYADIPNCRDQFYPIKSKSNLCEQISAGGGGGGVVPAVPTLHVAKRTVAEDKEIYSPPER